MQTSFAMRLSQRFRPGMEARVLGRMLAIYGLLGIATGLAAVAFSFMVDFASEHLLQRLAGIDAMAHGWSSEPSRFSLPDVSRLWVLVLPVLGGAASGWLCARFAPEAMGSGTNTIIDAYHQRGGLVRRRVMSIKAVASAVTIGSGGSGGVEGPIGLIGGGIGSSIARYFDLTPAERRILLMAGFAAGLGAMFHAPMAASIFAAEMLYRELDIEHEVLVPAIISSTLAYAVYGAVRGWEPILSLGPIDFSGVLELIPYLVLAIVVAGAGRLFVRLFLECRRRVGQISKIPLWVRPALGGFGVGVIGLFAPSVCGGGYAIAQTAADGTAGVVALLGLALAKIVATSLTVGTGGSGGLFAPSLVIGAALGGAVGLAAHEIAPTVVVFPASFAVVGMAGFFATVVSAPLATVIMVSEVAGDYRLLVPTLWVSTIAWFLARRFSLFGDQIRSRLEAPGHLADMMDAVLRRIPVREALDAHRPPPITVPPDLSLRALVQHFASTSQGVFPIVEAGGRRLLGVVDGRQLRRTIGEQGIDELLIARDFEVPAVTCEPGDTLLDAVSRMAASGFDEIVVVDVDAAGDEHLLGILSRREVVSAYHRRMLQTAPGAPAASSPPAPAGPPGASGTPRRPNYTEPPIDPGPALLDALQRGGVVFDVQASDREEALREICRRAALPAICDREALLRVLLERERLSSTNIGDGLALPHPDTHDLPGMEEPRVVLGLLRRPIPWGDPEAPKVETVCLLLSPSGNFHLALLGAIARSLSDPALRQLLQKGASPKAIHARFRELLEKPGTSRS